MQFHILVMISFKIYSSDSRYPSWIQSESENLSFVFQYKKVMNLKIIFLWLFRLLSTKIFKSAVASSYYRAVYSASRLSSNLRKITCSKSFVHPNRHVKNARILRKQKFAWINRLRKSNEHLFIRYLQPILLLYNW